ncbi:hypothetical protein OIE68_19180 [Nocardia vinacea]|nr:hypothetical protein OIE68_19180 [Nocardia vinacea]
MRHDEIAVGKVDHTVVCDSEFDLDLFEMGSCCDGFGCGDLGFDEGSGFGDCVDADHDVVVVGVAVSGPGFLDTDKFDHADCGEEMVGGLGLVGAVEEHVCFALRDQVGVAVCAGGRRRLVGDFGETVAVSNPKALNGGASGTGR